MTDKTENVGNNSKDASLHSSFKQNQGAWVVSGYVLTNAVSSGAFLLLFVGLFLNHVLEQPFMTVRPSAIYTGTIISLLFLFLTAILLIRDIADFSKFFKGLLNPSNGSRFVFGAYAIISFGILISLFAVSIWFKWKPSSIILIYLTAFAALLVSISTTYLLDQNKNDFHWNKFSLTLHMLSHSFMAGGAAYSIADAFFRIGTTWGFYVDMVLHIAIVSNISVSILEFILTRKNESQMHLVREITTGNFKYLFWGGNILLGNIIPFIIIFFSNKPILQTLAGLFILIGIWIMDKIWIGAPQYVKTKYQTKEVINNG